MKLLNMEILRSWSPCYDPTRYLPEDWQGTILDILKNESIPLEDRLWAAIRTELVSDKLMRLFAVWSCRQTLEFIKNLDPRSVECVNVAERFALGEASLEELADAESAAESAARSAAWSAARSAQVSKLIEMIEAENK